MIQRVRPSVSGLFALAFFAMTTPALAATSVPFTVNMSEAVDVTGTPRVAVDVGGVTRYATYTSGTGTSALVFTYTATAGDIDLDGVTLSSPVDLNGGTLKDLAGNDATPSFTVPDTSNVKINYPSLSMDFAYDSDGRYTLNGTIHNDLSSLLAATGGTFSRSSIGTYFDSSGILQTASSGNPRFDYDPVTHVASGIRIEDSKTNLRTYSAETDNVTNWTRAGVTMTANTFLAPDGTTTAEMIIPTATTGQHRIYEATRQTVTAGVTYTASVFVRSAGAQYLDLYLGYTNFPTGNGATFDLTNGTVVRTFTSTTPRIQSIGNNWYRCSITVTSSVSGSTNSSFFIVHSVNSGTANISTTGDGVSGYYVWGVQYEQSSFPTSYIPTSGSAVTRAADRLTIPTGIWYNAASGAIFSDYTITYVGGTAYPGSAVIGDGTSNVGITLYVSDANTDLKRAQIKSAATITADISAGSAYSSGSTARQALAYANNDAITAADGTISSQDTSVTIPTVTNLYAGGTGNGITSGLNGTLRSIKYYPLRLTNTQLQLLTQ